MPKCSGECGKPGCNKHFRTTGQYKQHAVKAVRDKHNARLRKRLRALRQPCPTCGKIIKGGNLRAHMKRIHDTVPVSKRLPVPERFTPHKHMFTHVKLQVHRNIQNDIAKRKRWSSVEQQSLLDMNNDPAKHQIAIQICDRVLALGDKDDYGGNITGITKLVFEAYSLFTISQDRSDDTRIHYVDKGVSNILITIKGMNVNSSLRPWSLAVDARKGRTPDVRNVCENLREEMSRVVSAEEIAEIMAREKTSMNSALAHQMGKKPCMNILYMGVYNTFKKDPNAQEVYGTTANMFERVYEEVYEAVCPISSITMIGYAYNRLSSGSRWIPHPFQPSLNAIDPTKGHVPGNLRVVCRFLTQQDSAKRNTLKAEHVQRWTRELWNRYVGV